jgi:hypothetical protein
VARAAARGPHRAPHPIAPAPPLPPQKKRRELTRSRRFFSEMLYRLLLDDRLQILDDLIDPCERL